MATATIIILWALGAWVTYNAVVALRLGRPGVLTLVGCLLTWPVSALLSLRI